MKPPQSQHHGSKLWKTEFRTRLVVGAIGAVLAGAAGYLALFRLGGALVMLSYDAPFVVHRAGSSNEICIVYLDQLRGELLDRRIQADLLKALGKSGAKAVIYDVLFDLEAPDPKTDEEFASAIRQFRGVDEGGKHLGGMRERLVLFAAGRSQINQMGAFMEQVILPTEKLLDAASGYGLALIVHDKTFTVRELIAGTVDDPSLSWVAASKLDSKLNETDRTRPRWLNYASPRKAFPAFPAREVLNGVAPHLLREKIVIIGGAPGIVGAAAGQDLFATPFHLLDSLGSQEPLMSGVELQANALNNLLHANWLTRTNPKEELWLILLSGLVAGIAFSRLSPLRGIGVGVAFIVGLIGVAIFLVHNQQIWFPWAIIAFLQIPVALGWSSGAHFYIERFHRQKISGEQERLRQAFARYLSPEMLKRLTASGYILETGGERMDVAIMFTDLENYTSMCQRVKDPARIIVALNDYFQRTTGHILDHDGTIIQFIGDAIFAAWGAPLADPDAPRKAVMAAWKLFESDKLVVEGEPLRTRMGLHFGEVVAGNIGSDRHMDYGLIGDAVNLAARLEALNKLLGTHILLSDTMHAHIDDGFRTRRIGQFRVKGRDTVTTVYELVGPALQAEMPLWIAAYQNALIALETDDPIRARCLFMSAAELRGKNGDGPSDFFIKLIDRAEPMPSGVVLLRDK